MSDSFALPFELSADSVTHWLQTVDGLTHVEKVNLFYKVINKLNTLPIEPSVLFVVLDKLTEPFLIQSNILEHIALNEKKNSSSKVKKISGLAIKLPKKLCFAYCKIADDNATAKDQTMTCIYRAMQILSLLVKRNAVFYEAPDYALWKKLGELYVKAEMAQLLSIYIEDWTSGLVYLPTIEAIINQILLFYSCNPYCYSPSDISDIFSAAVDLTKFLKLEKAASGFAHSYWNPYDQLPPVSANPGIAVDNALYLDFSKLIEYFEANADAIDKYPVFAKPFRRLSAYSDIRRSVDPATLADCRLMIGSTQALKFLNVLTSRYRIIQLSGVTRGKTDVANMELVPLDDGKNTLASLSTKILKDEKNLFVAKVKTYQTSHRRFVAAKIGNLECSMDEPVVMVYEDQRPFFSLIRHIRIETGIKLKSLLLEIIEGTVYPIEIKDTQCFLIVRSGGGSELFFPVGDIRIDDSVSFTAKALENQVFQVDKFIELTAHFSRFQVICNRA